MTKDTEIFNFSWIVFAVCACKVHTNIGFELQISRASPIWLCFHVQKMLLVLPCLLCAPQWNWRTILGKEEFVKLTWSDKKSGWETKNPQKWPLEFSRKVANAIVFWHFRHVNRKKYTRGNSFFCFYLFLINFGCCSNWLLHVNTCSESYASCNSHKNSGLVAWF